MVRDNQILSPNYYSIEWSYMNNETTFICGPHLAVKKSYIIPLIPIVLPEKSLSSDLIRNIEGTGDDSAAESEYVSGFCIERKIDLTNHIKWWGSNKNRQPDAGTRLSEEKKHGFAGGDIYSELKTLEQKVQPTEPYKLPELGRLHNEKKHKSSSMSALSILSQSAAYKSMQEKVAKRQENSTDNDENENKNIVNELDRGKAVEKPSNHDGGNDRLDIAMGMSGALSLQRNVYPLTPFLSAPLMTTYNTVDPLVDPVLWTSLVPMLPASLSRPAEVGIMTKVFYLIYEEEDYMKNI
jgi:AP2-like factor (ANT lineage)